MTTTVSSSKRLEARISAELHTMLKQAAAQEGRTLTDFVVEAVQAAARESIERSQVMRLSIANQQAFIDALISPPAPNEALKRAFKKRETLLKPTNG